MSDNSLKIASDITKTWLTAVGNLQGVESTQMLKDPEQIKKVFKAAYDIVCECNRK